MRVPRDVVGEIRARNNEINTILEKALGEDVEVSELDRADIKRLHYLTDELEDLAAEIEETGAAPAAVFGADRGGWTGGGYGPGGAAGFDPRRERTVGDVVVDDVAFKAWLKSIAPRVGVVDANEFRKSPEIALHSLFDADAFKTVISSANAGALVRPDRTGILDPGPFRRPLAVRDLISLSETESDVVEFVRVLAETNAAAPTAEATSASTGLKPESAMTFQLDTAAVKNITHWLPASRRILSDAKQLRGHVNNFLRYGLEEELEDQVVNGAGTGENLTGILNTSGLTSQAFDTNIIRTARKARTKVRTVGRARPTAYLMHPLDWEAFDLSVDNEERYYFGGPAVLGVPKLWGLPVVECEAVPAGTALVADWRLAMLWDQEMAKIYVSDSHADFFARNLIAFLCEMRAAFAVLRPAAFVEFPLA